MLSKHLSLSLHLQTSCKDLKKTYTQRREEAEQRAELLREEMDRESASLDGAISPLSEHHSLGQKAGGVADCASDNFPRQAGGDRLPLAKRI